ncbi:MAG TPA: zf-HC2 domain-containing protein [candidate division WOR-3 bacterium]|uniref:Zf-HC2 domain-containing protein n=1 Tax=candidate division WOR-3 bacterium TaxID=2052148 RepID=A0A9C9ELL6_UNCW3|nr:zf-HC2 domain-containing protein [candidate division WOR-3 bacterium]
MNCLEIQEKIIDLVIGDLTAEDELAIREHLKKCPICREEFQFISDCIQCWSIQETEMCEYYFQDTYWDNFVMSVHEKISHEKIEKRFPFHIVIPVAASALLVGVLGYYLFFKPSPRETVEQVPSYYEYDPYNEMDELSPEQTEEFIKMINQQYGE